MTSTYCSSVALFDSKIQALLFLVIPSFSDCIFVRFFATPTSSARTYQIFFFKVTNATVNSGIKRNLCVVEVLEQQK